MSLEIPVVEDKKLFMDRPDLVAANAIHREDRFFIVASRLRVVASDDQGEWRTPLSVARRAEHEAIVAFLLASGAKE
jgi:hypothetical protein